MCEKFAIVCAHICRGSQKVIWFGAYGKMVNNPNYTSPRGRIIQVKGYNYFVKNRSF